MSLLNRLLSVEWSELRATFPWVEALHACPQDPAWHAEGDVGIHTQMVLQALSSLSAFQALPDETKSELALAALLHDVAKPMTTVREADGRVTARGHSVRGARLAREILYREGVDPIRREAAVALIRHHQAPFFLIEKANPQALAIRISHALPSCHRLALLTEADARGRTCADLPRLRETIALFAAFAEEEGCLHGPWPFASDAARVRWFQDPARSPFDPGHHEPSCEVLLMSGLPGAGKDRWLAAHWSGPVISLDQIRQELRLGPTDPQGPVIECARARAKEHLRAGRSFAWNATNISRDHRRRCLDLFTRYGARVRLVYVEVPLARLYAQNREREAPVPERVLERLIGKLEVPELTEAHERVWAVEGRD